MNRLHIAAFLTLLLMACGGKDDGGRVLHFTGRDETEENFRARIRETVVDNPLGMKLVCYQVKDLSAKAAVELLKTTSDSSTVPKGAIPKPGQTAIAADLERSAEIVQEECKRLPYGS